MQLKKYLLAVLVVSLPSFAQKVATNPISGQNIVQPVGAQFSANNRAGIPYVVASYNWSQTDVAGSLGNLTSAGSNTLTLTPCPAGIDHTASVNAPYGVYISGVGTAEAVRVTGGTCTSGAASGTITVTTANTHGAGFTVGSATGGNQEAINVADAGGATHAVIQEVPTGGSDSVNYSIYWPVFLKSNKGLLNGYGAKWACYTRAVCLMVGDYASSSGQYSVVQGLELQSAVNVPGAHIANVTAASGVFTVNTSSAHGLVANDYAILYYSTPAQTNEARVLVLSTPSSTQFTYQIGTTTTFSPSSGFGWVAVENAAIEAETNGTKLQDIKILTGIGRGRFHQGVVVDNDQHFIIDGMTNGGSSTAIRCDSNFCGNLIYLRGDQGVAPVAYLHHLEASLQCGGNGVRDAAGNTLDVQDSVIQGNNQYAIYYAGGLQSWSVNNVYNEVGSCANPFYPGSLQAAAGLISNGSPVTVTGNAPVGGVFPTFVSGGSTASQRNYYVVPRDTAYNPVPYGPMLFIGTALPTSGAVSIPLYWPNPDLLNSVSRTFDILVTIGTAQTSAPYTGNAFSIVTNTGGSCNTSGICTYTDTQAATTAYTVTSATTFTPSLPFWPGAVILGSSASLYIDQCGQSSPIISTSYLPKVFCKRGPATGFPYTYTPFWAVYPQGDSVGNNNPKIGAQVLQIGPASGGFASGVTGGLNFNPGPLASVAPRQIITTMDGSPQQTFATPGYVRTGSKKDSFIGTDSTTSVGSQDQTYGAPGGHNFYVNDVGTSGSTWALHIGASGPQVKKSTYSVLNAATPCSSSTEGSMAAVTDSITSTWGATVAGGGSSHVLAYCDGTHWTVAAD